jgi:N-acyl homoserine lactone hydrolase
MFKKFMSLLIFASTLQIAIAQEKIPLKMYALHCGNIDVRDLSLFSDIGDYDGKTANFANTCFLIAHPNGYLLWDTGLADSLIEKPETKGSFYLSKTVTISQQLQEIGITPKDITYVAISHAHFDHTGGLENFPHSTWIINKYEIEHAKENPESYFDFTKLSGWETVNKEITTGDFDVFKDGTIKILKTPGHTPGHQVLQVNLPKTGIVIISGDAFHQRTSFEPLRIPVFNTNRAESIASADRIKGILKNTGGRIIIMHDKNDIESLPAFPNYLE